ncbi:hypothetical protein Hamer_G025393 [Homarus americanus]|uniref:Uncharacterized protein n=1 Tax=Homarus americanus TaxID=6706 RepID=A0A8J5JIS1_HOMAM|nr:hypothetical protein Hamer_G025393 [Homarus americanus]
MMMEGERKDLTIPSVKDLAILILDLFLAGVSLRPSPSPGCSTIWPPTRRMPYTEAVIHEIYVIFWQLQLGGYFILRALLLQN